MASRMGVTTAMVACLGDDSYGAGYLENLSGRGIDCASVRRDAGASTGIAQVCCRSCLVDDRLEGRGREERDTFS